MDNILITGSSRGIGRAIAVALAADDRKLYLTGRDKNALDEACREVEKKQARAVGIIADLSKTDDIQNLTDTIDDKQIKAIIHNAGIATVEPFEELTLESWNRTFTVNVTAPFLITKNLSSKLAEGSSIINILSIASHGGFANWSSYCMSKFALDGFMKSIKEELRERKIRVINIYPGAVATDIWGTLPGDVDLNGMMRPERIADAVKFAMDQPCTTSIDEITVTNLSGHL